MKSLTPVVTATIAYYTPLLQRYARLLIKDELAAVKIVDQVLEDEFLLDEVTTPVNIRWQLKTNLLARCHCLIQFNIFNRQLVKVPGRNSKPIIVSSNDIKYFFK